MSLKEHNNLYSDSNHPTAAPVTFKRTVSCIFSAFVGSCLVGLAVYGARIFQPNQVWFLFVTSGAIAGGLAAAIETGRAKTVWLVAVSFFVVFLGFSRPTTMALALRDSLNIPALFCSVWLAQVVSLKASMWRLIRVPVWGLYFAICHLVTFGILTVANGLSLKMGSGSLMALVGGLVGLGVGLGFVVFEQLGTKPVGTVKLAGDG